MPAFLGFLGVLAFSFTLPATRVAVGELDPTFVGIGREAVAAVPAALILLATRARWRTLWPPSGRGSSGAVGAR
jgi:hypothetical protein